VVLSNEAVKRVEKGDSMQEIASELDVGRAVVGDRTSRHFR
jgi:hypothetical protein